MEQEIAAHILAVELTILNATTPTEIDVAFAILVRQRIAALMVEDETLFVEQRDQLAGLVARHAVPAIYPLRDYVDAGGLMSYGPSWLDAWRVAGTYVGHILNGEKPDASRLSSISRPQISGHRDADTGLVACRRSD